MFEEEKNTCDCGQEHLGEEIDNCNYDCDYDDDFGECIITMTDTETGEDYSFVIADDFAFGDEHYCVLVTIDEDAEPEMIITKVVTMEDGSEGLMSLDDSEYDRIYAEYERICEEETDEDEDSEEEI
ncbi:MAG: DUF1292 domain-containing protein [Saccharofermentanales bacterium]|jgi:hypothetical protein|nr:DUF1292 domain-containing protein [Clostridiaceae bacterium]